MTQQTPLKLQYVSMKFDAGSRFDIFADDKLTKIYLDREQVGKYMARELDRSKYDYPIRIYSAVVERDGVTETIETVLAKDVANLIPSEILEITRQKYPRPIYKIDKPKLIETIGIVGAEVWIYRGKGCNLIKLKDIAGFLNWQEDNPQFVFAACKHDIFFDGDYYYIDLRKVWSLLCRFGGAAKNVRELFNTEIFLELPQGGCEGFIDAREYKKCQSPLGEFIIYAGKGFAENRFFAASWNLEDLLDEDNEHGGALDTVADLVGYVVSGRVYYRLDDVGKFAKLYASEIWSGHNEQNQNLKRAWKFIEWYREFYPAFIKANTPYRAFTHYVEPVCEEPAEKVADNISVKEFFATFDRAVEDFKKQFEELKDESN